MVARSVLVVLLDLIGDGDEVLVIGVAWVGTLDVLLLGQTREKITAAVVGGCVTTEWRRWQLAGSMVLN
jgi:hypothetical protein